jgi:uncharacterized protein (TIGR02246 family)
MKRFAFFFLAFPLLCAFGSQQASAPPKIDAEKSLIKAVLDNYIVSIEKEDINLYAKVMAHDLSMVNFGTSEEPIIGWDALKKLIEGQNAALSDTKIEVRDVKIRVAANKKFGWATSLWNFQAKMGGKAMALPVRCTWILEKKDGAWVIIHFHKSVAAKE